MDNDDYAGITAELEAMRVVYEALEPLSGASRLRALRWLLDRFGMDVVSRVP